MREFIRGCALFGASVILLLIAGLLCQRFITPPEPDGSASLRLEARSAIQDVPTPELWFGLLVMLAEAEALLGDPHAARRTFTEAREFSEKIPPRIPPAIDCSDAPNSRLRAIGAAQLRAGLIDDACTTYARVDSPLSVLSKPPRSDWSLCAGSRALADKGDYSGALATAYQVVDDSRGDRTSALSYIGSQQARAGDPCGAERLAQQIENPFAQAEVTARASIAFADAGRTEEARRALRDACSQLQTAGRDQASRFWRAAVVAIAQAHTALGQVEAANRVVESIDDRELQCMVMRGIAVQQTLGGKPEAALATLTAMPPHFTMPATRYVLARQLWKCGYSDAANDQVEWLTDQMRLRSGESRAYYATFVARLYGEFGMLEEIRTFTRSDPSPEFRARVLVNGLTGMAKRNRAAGTD